MCKLGGGLVPKTKGRRWKGAEQDRSQGGILWWGSEAGPDLAWFRDRSVQRMAVAHPRVLDPFAGGGAIPLEAMRLGCEVEARRSQPGRLVHS